MLLQLNKTHLRNALQKFLFRI